jgi:hypothetical protein
MRHLCFWSDESGRQTPSILARPAPSCAIRWVGGWGYPSCYDQRDYGASGDELGRGPSVAECMTDLVDVFKAIPLAP